MYIALRWLLGLTLAMWISMCCIDVLFTRNFEIKEKCSYQKTIPVTSNTTVANHKVELRRDKYYNHKTDKPHSNAFLPLSMFLSGALAVSLYNRKKEIAFHTKQRISEIITSPAVERFQEYSQITVNWVWDCAIKYSKISWVCISNIIIKLWHKLCAFLRRKQPHKPKPRINIILLKKLQEIGKERRNLGQLFRSAIHENKNIRMQYKLESLAKNRLAQYIEDTQKAIKESRSSFVNFQQLYLSTHQENSFLKARIKKVTKERDEAEKNLLQIINEVYKSRNNHLKAFCSRFIVKTGDNLLQTDAGAGIKQFLDTSRKPVATTSNWQLSDRPNIQIGSTHSCPMCDNKRSAEVIKSDIFVPIVSRNAPKLRGLPGEFVCTVKDKLYEYDISSDLDDGDTIRRIRQYSVYFDQDCLLDSITSITEIHNESRPTAPRRHVLSDSTSYPITTQRFLTGSNAFQKFMKNNNNVISSPSPTTSSAIM